MKRLRGGMVAFGVGMAVAACGSTATSSTTTTVGPVVSYQQSTPDEIAHERGALPPGALVSGLISSHGGQFLTDSASRTVFLHGVNLVMKRAPYIYTVVPGTATSFTATDAARISGLGFNTVRLGIIWAGLEPGRSGANDPAICAPGRPHDPGQWDQGVASRYLDQVSKVVSVLGTAHLSVLLDMHQDVYNEVFRGEGAPLWAVCSGDAPLIALPGRWSHNYSNPALDTAYGHFWRNDVKGDLQGEFDRAWRAVATRFAANPAILGYDPFNEPFSTGQQPSEIGHFAIELECFYTGRRTPGRIQRDDHPVHCGKDVPWLGVIPVIERADRRHLVFVEPDNFNVGKEPNLLGPLPFAHLVFNFHVYCGSRSPLTGDPTNLSKCKASELNQLVARTKARAGLATRVQPGGPAWFLSEYGATRSVALLNQVVRFADIFNLGWDYWSWRYDNDPTGSSHEAIVKPDGSLGPQLSALVVTYAQAIAGTPLTSFTDRASNTYALVFKVNTKATLPTSIWVHQAGYPHGYCARVTNAEVTSPPGASHLLVTAHGPGQVSVTISPGGCPATSQP